MAWPPATHQDVQDAVSSLRASYVNVRDYGAAGNNATDDAAAIQAAINAAASAGGTVLFPPGVYIIGTTLTLPGGVHLRGSGPGGDVFSGTDARLPYLGTALRLKAGANVDLIKTTNFAALTGTASPSAYTTPNRFGVHDMVLDGNKAGNSSGRCLVIYGRSYWLDNVVIQNAAGDGLYSEYGTTAGYDNEAQIHNLRSTDNGGHGVNFLGPHDSAFTNIFAARNGGSGFVLGPTCGSTMVTNMHNWGNGAYNFDVACSDASFVNCVCDGAGGQGLAGVRVTTSDVRWVGGSIYGTNTNGEVLLQVGDGTTPITLRGVDFYTRWWNLELGSVPVRYMANVTSGFGNRFAGPMEAGINSRFLVGQGRTTVTSAQTLPVTTLTVASTASFPSSGTLYIGIPGVGVTSATYSGKTATTFTGVSDSDTFTIPSGTVVWQRIDASPHDTFMLRAADGASLGMMQLGADLGGSTLYVDQTVVFVDGLNLIDGASLAVGTGAGAKIGTATSQKLGFYGNTPVTRPTLSYSRSGAGETAADAALRSALATLGLITDSTTT